MAIAPGDAARFPPRALTFFRFLLAAVILVPFAIVRRAFPKGWSEWWRLILFSLSGFSMNLHLGYAGLADSTPSHSVLIRGLEPVFIAVNAVLFLRERVTPPLVLASVLGMVGVVFIIDPRQLIEGSWRFGDLLIFLSVAVESFCSITARSLMRRHAPLVVTAWGLAVGTLISLPFAWGELGEVRWTASSIFPLVYLGVLCTAVGYLIWFTAIQRFPVARVGMTIFLQPLFGVVVAMLFAGDRPSAVTWVGGALTLAGAGLVVMAESRVSASKS